MITAWSDQSAVWIYKLLPWSQPLGVTLRRQPAARIRLKETPLISLWCFRAKQQFHAATGLQVRIPPGCGKPILTPLTRFGAQITGGQLGYRGEAEWGRCMCWTGAMGWVGGLGAARQCCYSGGHTDRARSESCVCYRSRSGSLHLFPCSSALLDCRAFL